MLKAPSEYRGVKMRTHSVLNSEARHSYLQWIGVRVGAAAIALDYGLTVYWGQVIAISEKGIVTFQYFAGEGIGFKTRDFHPYRCIRDPFHETLPLCKILWSRESVIMHFRQSVIPKLKEFPAYYAEIESMNSIVYCQYCSYDEEYCKCLRCEDCGRIYPYECRSDEECV